jgi:hypothetical protein
MNKVAVTARVSALSRRVLVVANKSLLVNPETSLPLPHDHHPLLLLRLGVDYFPCNLTPKGLGLVFFLRFFVFRLGGTTKTYPEANSSGCWMKALKVDENGFKWMKKVKMFEFLATIMFFLDPNFAKNRSEVKKIRLLAKFRQ